MEISITTSGITEKDVCTINVSDSVVTYIGYASEKQIIVKNETVTPKLIILPESAKDNYIEYSIKDYGIAKVDNKGAVTGLKAGKTILTATLVKLSTSTEIEVRDNIKHVESITVDKTEVTLQ